MWEESECDGRRERDGEMKEWIEWDKERQSERERNDCTCVGRRKR